VRGLSWSPAAETFEADSSSRDCRCNAQRAAEDGLFLLGSVV